MPHIVINGTFSLEEFAACYSPLVQDVPGGALKLMDMFLNQERTCALIEALAAEGGPPNRFFVMLSQRGEKTTVKIYPGSDPEKTPGVKKLLALVARQVREAFPETVYGSTNLQDYLL